MPTVNSHFSRDASSFSRVCRLRALTALASCFSCFRRGMRSGDSVVVVWRDRIGCERDKAGRGLRARLAVCGRGRWHCGQASERVARGHCRSHGRSMSPRARKVGERMDPQEEEKIGLVAVGGMAVKLARILSLESEWESMKDGIKRGGDHGPYHTVITLTADIQSVR